MRITAVIPVKPLHLGKSRLAGVLSEPERALLNQRMYLKTLNILNRISEIERVLVVSRDAQVLSYAQEHHALPVEETANDLNLALEQVAGMIRQYSPRQPLLVVPADLPLVEEADLRQVIEHDPGPPGVVLVPDRHLKGTNVILTNPVGLLRYTFGQGSFQKHEEAARVISARLVVLKLPSLALDLDLPEDLSMVQERIGVV
jgi:2-phospho-L-lactate guanylyltransferase